MDYKKYKLIYSQRVIDTLDDIYNYIVNELGSTVNAKKKIASIRKDLQRLEFFPEGGFDADEKFGKRLDPKYKTKGLTLSKDYITLYNIFEDEVRIAYLLPIRSNYMDLFR